MSDIKDPEEGRLSPEQYAERLREARKRTAIMKRQYRTEREKKRSKDAAKRWSDRHAEKHAEIKKSIVVSNTAKAPANRQTRRRYAKMLNAFKIPGGWQTFNKSHKERFGYYEPINRNRKNKPNSSNSIAAAIAEGDK